MSIILSIAICTHNRANILEITLPIIKDYWEDGIELLLIDNGSVDNTKQVFENIGFDNAKYIFEPNIGLSHARNRAIFESKSNWIFYLDDDAKVQSDTIRIAKNIIKNFPNYGIIGGVFKPWFIDEKPKWLPDDFGFFLPDFNQFKKIIDINDFLPIGCILLYNKKIMNIFSNFQFNLGMKGKQIGYGEETDICIKAIKNSIDVGIEPSWQIEHLVASYKYRLRWHLKAIVAHGSADELIESSNIILLYYTFIKSIGGMIIKRLPINIINILFKRGYFWQNFIYETIKPTIYFWGRLNANVNCK